MMVMMMNDNEELVWITKVEKKGKKYQVYTTDSEEILLLTEDAIVNNRIIKGNSYSKDEFKKIKKSVDEVNIFDSILKFIDFKMRTEKEVREKLLTKTTEEKIINNIIKRLKELNFIDDERYTKIYIEQEIRKNSGPKLIKYNLISKGINEELIDKYLNNLDENSQREMALNIGKNTLKSLAGEPINKQKEALYNKLTMKGYNTNIINYVMNNIEYQDVDYDKLKALYEKIKEKENDKNKIIQKLLSKGYEYSDIKKLF